eukprot:4125491-Lingulodinium_polyedra.AAC.1
MQPLWLGRVCTVLASLSGNETAGQASALALLAGSPNALLRALLGDGSLLDLLLGSEHRFPLLGRLA